MIDLSKYPTLQRARYAIGLALTQRKREEQEENFDRELEELRLADAVVRELVKALRPFTREGSMSFAHFDWDDIVKARALVEKYGGKP